jgi:multiple sugar transport system ATP-binding protein
MNFLDVERRDGALHHDEFVYDLPEETRATLSDAPSTLTLGIRPEHIELVEPGVGNAIEATVEVVEPMGELSYIYLSLGGETYTASVDGDLLVEEGDVVAVEFPPDKIHLFDRETGETLVNSEVTQRTVASRTNPASSA